MVSRAKEAIIKAQKFILSQRNERGLWQDFRSQNHGCGIDWVSSYTGLALLNAGASTKELYLTARSIAQRQTKEGGWGYNNDISAPDADSTAFSILFLSRFDYKAEIKRARRFLLQHQKADGGISTYTEKLLRQDYEGRLPSEASVDGWCAAIPEISAIVIQAITNNKILAFIKKTQNKNGSWPSYWFNDNIYATAQCIKAMCNKEQEEIIKAQKWLATQNPRIPFYRSLLVRGIAGNKKYKDKADSKISELLNMQQEDGSWPSYPILRVPSFSNLSPWENLERWRDDMQDQNRIFTTATCLESLVLTQKA